MSKARFPKEFELMGHKINVERDDDLYTSSQAIGIASYLDNIIKIQGKNNCPAVSVSLQEQTFYHELVHFIFYLLGEEDLNQNEKLVDNIGQMLYQFMKTRKFK